MKGNLFILSGPSGVGKNAVERKLKGLVTNLHRVLTTTTREPRPQEQHGVDYNFITKQSFKALIEQDAFFEWAVVHDNFYGSLKKHVVDDLEAGKQLLMIIDVQGAIEIKKSYPEAHLLFLEPESLEQLQERIARRADMSEADLALRLENAQKELALRDFYDYSIVNKEGKLDQTASEVAQIINSTIKASQE